MLLNRIPKVLLIAAALCVYSSIADAGGICPARQGNPLRYVDVFDGPPQEHATLVPDQDGTSSGHWDLGYVYDAGRIVTVRCKYRNGKKLDVRIPTKVDRCSYRINSQKSLDIRCK